VAVVGTFYVVTNGVGMALVRAPTRTFVLILTVVLVQFLEPLNARTDVASGCIDADRAPGVAVISAVGKALVNVLTGGLTVSAEPIVTVTHECRLKIHARRIGVTFFTMTSTIVRSCGWKKKKKLGNQRD